MKILKAARGKKTLERNDNKNDGQLFKKQWKWWQWNGIFKILKERKNCQARILHPVKMNFKKKGTKGILIFMKAEQTYPIICILLYVSWSVCLLLFCTFSFALLCATNKWNGGTHFTKKVVLKEILHADGKIHQMETWIYEEEWKDL